MDYKQFGFSANERDRVRNVLKRLKEGGVDSAFAKSVIAISGSESNFCWASDALAGTDAIIACPSPTTIIGLEPKDGDYARMELINGFSTPGARKAALILGLVVQDSSSAKATYLATGAKNPNSKGQHQLFELAMLHRDTNLAKGFSLGPTQMYLLYSKALGGADPDRGSDWNDLYALYRCADPQAIFTRLRYTNKPPFPKMADDRTTAISWLRRICQAGCSDANATKYYDTFYGNNFKKVLSYTTDL